MKRYSGAKLAQHIERQGRRVYWVADQVGVSPSLLYRMMNGTRGITDENAQALAEVLELDIDDLYESDPVLAGMSEVAS